MRFSLLLILILAFPLGATTFQLQSIDQQLKEADGVIIGHYLKQKVVELETGAIATQYVFKMNKEFGIQSELFGMDEVIVHYPGGSLGDKHIKVEGVPSFIPGEKVVVFIKNVQHRYWGLNLGFGSFKVINYGKETLLVNTLFPSETLVGQVTIEEFEKVVKAVKGQNMKVVFAPIYPADTESTGTLGRAPASVLEVKNRSIASKPDQRENIPDGPGFNPYWLVMVLAFLGGVFRLMRQKAAK